MSGELQADDPAAAFEALREEVAQLRQALEQRPASEAVDYTPSLAAVAKGLKNVEGRLDAIEQRPALKLTPEGHARAFDQALDMQRRQLRADYAEGQRALSSGAHKVETAFGALRSKQLQDRWLIGAAGAGAVGGVVLWTVLSGPIARVLPGGQAEKMAAATLGKDRVAAGEQMMVSGDPNGWAQAMKALRIYLANRDSITACEQNQAGATATAHCKIVLDIPGAP